MSDKSTYYITTPIYYVNAAPHIGSAYTSISCDFLARFMRLCGRDVRYLTGTDEHGQKVQQAAEAKGVEPQAFTDEISKIFRDMNETLNISNDYFIRTTDEDHKIGAQLMWQELKDSGNIYLDKYAGWYARGDEAFFNEDELTTNDKGQKIAPSGHICEWVEEESYFFKLSAWEKPLLEFYEANPDFIGPDSRRNEVLSFVKGGLRDLSISRTTFSWGVPVPDDEKHVMYVWLDALTNYISYLGYGKEGSDGADYKKFWPADVHMVGKDILRFHAVYWPAFLMAAKQPLPKRIYAHGWLTVEGQKMSKSLGNVISPDELVERYGVDAARYALMSNIPFGNDGDFSHEKAVQKINTDLANELGNLCQRSLSMIFKNCDGKVPEYGEFTKEDKALLDAALKAHDIALAHIEKQEIHKALEAIWAVAGDGNRYIDEEAPWKLKKTDIERMQTVLYVLAETIRHLAILVQPIVPEGAAKILDQLSIAENKRSFAELGEKGRLIAGVELPKPEGVFPRLELKTEELA